MNGAAVTENNAKAAASANRPISGTYNDNISGTLR
jgi:hypothetical protein